MPEPQDQQHQPESSLDPEAQHEIESREEEASAVLAAGPRAANRAGAFAFLALLAVVGAVVYYHFAGRGVDSFQNRLDVQLINHAELTMAAMEAEAPLAVVPSWPHSLYQNLRQDIVAYAGFAAFAAFLWSRSAAARARRDAFLVHDRLTREVAQLRERLDRLDGGSSRDMPASRSFKTVRKE